MLTRAVLLLLLLFSFGSPLYAATIYVDADATAGGNTGSDWSNAFTDLQDALLVTGSGDQIWVAAGTYYPGTTRSDFFYMINGAGIYGGFTGTETTLSGRDPETNSTILSGDIDKDGELNSGNSKHVFALGALDLDSSAILDGFTITGGYADTPGDMSGGGMINSGNSPAIINCTFRNNYASGNGGGISNGGGSPIFTNCTIRENQSNSIYGHGGGMYNFGSAPIVTGCSFIENYSNDGGGVYHDESAGTFTDCVFSKNSAKFIGAMYNYDSSPVISNCTFIENYADNGEGGGGGGGMFNSGGSPTITGCSFIRNKANEDCGALANMGSSATITNCSFIENKAVNGAGILGTSPNTTIAGCTFSGNIAANNGGAINGSVGQIISCTFIGNEAISGAGIYTSEGKIGNCILVGNQATVLGGGIYKESDSLTISNSILWGNSAITGGNEIYTAADLTTVIACDIQGSVGSGPGWDTSLGTDGGYNIDIDPGFVAADDYHLSPTSPCIDAGRSSAVPSGYGKDFDGETRFMDGNGDGIVVVDIGADEYVDSDGDGLTDQDETNTYGTNPQDPDSDNDGLSDGAEINTHGTDPTDADSDNDGIEDGEEIANGSDPAEIMAPGTPVLVAPETGAEATDLMATLSVSYMDGISAGLHEATRWQISRDENFSALTADFCSATLLLELTVQDLVLEPETCYYWRARFEASDGLERGWSETGSFTTAADNREDTNSNGLIDDQEVAGALFPFPESPAETGWQADCAIIGFLLEDGSDMQAGLRLSDDGSAMSFFKQISSSELTGDVPASFNMGAFSVKIQVSAPGASTTIRLYFSPTLLTEASQIYKFDTVNGWTDFSDETTFSEDLSYISLTLVDGGIGDADGVANGVIVDPIGIATYAVSGSSGGGSSSSSGCFIGSMRMD